MKTVLYWQRRATDPISSHEMDYILSGILGLSLTELYFNSGKQVDEEKGREISQALEKRLSGVPLQYILGETEFFSLPFYVKPGVFIPRPETELLVEHALKVIARMQHQQFGVACRRPMTKQSRSNLEAISTALDLCTGCGNIALSLAKNIPAAQFGREARIVAADISSFSIDVAKQNARRLGVSDRVEFLQGDLFNALCMPKAFDLIICNPPYIIGKEWKNLPEEVKYHEPRQALFGGEDGLDFYRRISCDARQYIKKGGRLLLEAGPAALAASILEKDGWRDIKIIKDYNNLDRIIFCKFNG